MSTLPFIAHCEALRARMPEETKACTCSLQRCAGWGSMAEMDWPQQSLTPIASLRDPDVHEPTFEEHHPNGTRYESANAPVALQFFPYNRCDVFACQTCQQTVLRYTEFGGYYVDHRARRVTRDTPGIATS